MLVCIVKFSKVLGGGIGKVERKVLTLRDGGIGYVDAYEP